MNCLHYSGLNTRWKFSELVLMIRNVWAKRVKNGYWRWQCILAERTGDGRAVESLGAHRPKRKKNVQNIQAKTCICDERCEGAPRGGLLKVSISINFFFLYINKREEGLASSGKVIL